MRYHHTNLLPLLLAVAVAACDASATRPADADAGTAPECVPHGPYADEVVGMVFASWEAHGHPVKHPFLLHAPVLFWDGGGEPLDGICGFSGQPLGCYDYEWNVVKLNTSLADRAELVTRELPQHVVQHLVWMTAGDYDRDREHPAWSDGTLSDVLEALHAD